MLKECLKECFYTFAGVGQWLFWQKVAARFRPGFRVCGTCKNRAGISCKKLHGSSDEVLPVHHAYVVCRGIWHKGSGGAIYE